MSRFTNALFVMLAIWLSSCSSSGRYRNVGILDINGVRTPGPDIHGARKYVEQGKDYFNLSVSFDVAKENRSHHTLKKKEDFDYESYGAGYAVTERLTLRVGVMNVFSTFNDMVWGASRGLEFKWGIDK